MKTLLASLLLVCFGGAFAQKPLMPNEKDIKKYRKAIKQYNKEHDSLTADFYFKRGGIRQDYLYLREAIADYDTAAQKDSLNPKIYYNRGLAKLDLTLYHRAIADFDKALELDPGKIFALNNRGISKYFLLEYDAAMQDYDAAIAIDPLFAEVYNNRGAVLIKLEKPEDACIQFRKAYELGDKASMKAIKELCGKE